jgi:hypothetical protein
LVGAGGAELVGGLLVVGELDGGAEVVGGWVVGLCEDGDDDGVVVGDCEGVGVTLGWTAAPWVVFRSNLLTWPIASKVYAAQIRAG